MTAATSNALTAGSDFLARMGDASRRRVAIARRVVPADAMRERALATSPPPQLVDDGFLLFAEIKRRSPADGALAPAYSSAVARARDYAATDVVAAISVLTEPDEFGGNLADLEAVTDAVRGVPALAKDFLVDPYQVHAARAHGAGGVLLIADLLDDTSLATMVEAAVECGMFALVESFERDAFVRAIAVRGGDPRVLLGVNCRDLRTLRVAPDRFASLAASLPADARCIAESGLHGPEDVAAVAALGYRGALVGTALMRAERPAEQAIALAAAGRRASCT